MAGWLQFFVNSAFGHRVFTVLIQITNQKMYTILSGLHTKQHYDLNAFKHQFKGLLVKQRVKIGLNS